MEAGIGVVIIGRNEGGRLEACLGAVGGWRCVYVDSGSVDGSVGVARGAGMEVVVLDAGRPFSAGRARNEGFRRVREVWPEVEYVQFVDGDCELAERWMEKARVFLEEHGEYAAVAGRLRERYPERSVYNRLCDWEWNVPTGDVGSCGGIAMMRAAEFEAAGGFDETVVAGEEPELCLRLRKMGKKIRRLDAEMALHDAAMTRFGQWWKRAVRGGYGGTDVAVRFEKGRGDFSRQVRSARLWGLGWPVAVVLVAVAGGVWGGWTGAVVLGFLATLVMPAQMTRVALREWRKGLELRTAVVYGALMMVAKWAHLQGQWRYWRDRRARRQLAVIEYKERSAACAGGAKN